MSIQIKSASQMTAQEIENCFSLLEQGKSVDMKSAKEIFPLCQTVALIVGNGAILACGAIKPLREDYAETIGEKSHYGVYLGFELGYVAVDSKFRGQGFARHTVKTLVREMEGSSLFAVTANSTMQKINLQCGFNKAGVEWKSKINPEQNLSLYVRGVWN
jgi:predicted GNAT family N-acyltransferase